MASPQQYRKWKRRDRVIGNAPLILFIPVAIFHFCGESSSAWFPRHYEWLVLAIIFFAAAVHRLLEPLSRDNDINHRRNKLKRTGWFVVLLLAGLLSMTVAIA